MNVLLLGRQKNSASNLTRLNVEAKFVRWAKGPTPKFFQQVYRQIVSQQNGNGENENKSKVLMIINEGLDPLEGMTDWLGFWE